MARNPVKVGPVIDGKKYMTIGEIAQYCDVEFATITSYRARGISNFPEPAFTVESSPVFAEEDIEAWNARRRGPGYWGKRKKATEDEQPAKPAAKRARKRTK